MKNVYSFDIFDTVLVRIWAKPHHLFWKLGQELKKDNLLEISLESWYDLRRHIEHQVRDRSHEEEITLREIYENLASSLNWSNSEMQSAIALEIELEKQSLFVVPEVQRQIEKYRQEDHEIIYISDMYLSESTIRELLEKYQCWEKQDSLYVSSTCKLTKASGYLFSYCLQQESLQNRQLVHQGDNFYSDFQVPKKLGIQANFFGKTSLNRYEEKIANCDRLPLELRSILAGSSRLTRLSSDRLTQTQSIIWDTTASAIAPVLFGFVFWCLEEARDRGIERLYFVARDGQILLKIARILCKNWGYTIDCRYLYGSRQAWHFPAIQEIGEYELNWLFDPTAFLSVHSLCQRVNLEPDEIGELLKRSGFPSSCWHDNLTIEERDSLKQIVQEREAIAIILERSAEFRENALGYFQQEGLAEPIRFGIVDIGWNGRLQYSLSRLLACGGMYPQEGVYGFYFALSRRFKAFTSEKLLSYFSDVDRPHEKRDRLCYYRELFELFVAADHGGTIKFTKEGENYHPVLRSEFNKRAIQWGLNIQQEAITQFCEIFTQNLDKKHYSGASSLTIAEILLNEFIKNPTHSEAEIFGSFKVAEDQNETQFHELAPQYNIIMSLSRLLFNRDIHHSVWFPAVQVRGSFLSRSLIAPISLKLRYFIWHKCMKLGRFLQFNRGAKE